MSKRDKKHEPRDPNVKFLHIREEAMRKTPKGSKLCPVTKGGTTVAYKISPGTPSSVPNVNLAKVIFAVASCHPTDNFNYTEARSKAAGRLRSPRFVREFEWSAPWAGTGKEDGLLPVLEQQVAGYLQERKEHAEAYIGRPIVG